MLASRLMTWGVFVLAALMIVVGLFCVNSGVAVVRMEIGWTQVIGGAVAASAGCVVLVMGLLLLKLEALQTSLDRDRQAMPTVNSAIPIQDPVKPDETPEAPPVPPPFAEPVPRPIHPLSPAARRDSLPFGAEVRPEPPLAAFLHPEDVNEPPTVQAPVRVDEPVLPVSAPALAEAEELEATHTPSVPPPDRVADPVADAAPARSRQTFLSSLLAKRPFGTATEPQTASSAKPAPREPVMPVDVPGGGIPPQRSPIDLSSGWDEDEPDVAPRLGAPSPSDDVYAHGASALPDEHHDRGDHASDHGLGHEAAREIDAAPDVVSPTAPVPDEPSLPEPVSVSIAPIVPPSAATDPLQPVVVGRYNAGAASYVMYSNGMIEVETEAGTHQFASMQELKNFIEKRDTRVS